MKKGKITKRTVTLNAGVAWYKPNQWQRIRGISEDRDRLEETYGEWQILAEQALKDFAARGLPVTKITVDTEKLLLWCNERGLKVNGAVAAVFLKRRLTSGFKQFHCSSQGI